MTGHYCLSPGLRNPEVRNATVQPDVRATSSQWGEDQLAYLGLAVVLVRLDP